ncbi:MAG: hypothetical protein IIV84_02085 [Selenomonadales bacterium]|nr:hypothetical protein [Selenomonadales bacterium]
MMIGKKIILLLVISILLGTAASNLIAEIANGYFHTTMDSLVGQYGEYDFIVQVQEEKKEEAKPVLEEVLSQHFAGGHYQEAPVIGGRANFFVAIPDAYKTKAVYERIDSYFTVLPGAAGLSIISEPRFSIRGVPQGALESVRHELERLEGVRFVFLDGPTIHVMIRDMADSARLQEEAARILTDNRVIEVRFPVGAEPDSPARLGEELARKLQAEYHPDFVRYVSIDEQRGEEARLRSVLSEMKRFLAAYRSKVTITMTEGGRLAVGDIVSLKSDNGKASARITAVRGQTATAHITAGDASEIGVNSAVYRYDEQMTETLVGEAVTDNPRHRLAQVVGSVGDLSAVLPQSGEDVGTFLQDAEMILADYDAKLSAVQSTASEMEKLSAIVGRASDELASADTTKLRDDLARATKAVDNVGRWLSLVSWASRDVREAKASLAEVEQHMVTLGTYLDEFHTRTQEAEKVKRFFGDMTASTRRTVDALEGFDAKRVQASLVQAEKSLRALVETDIASLTDEMQSVMGALPAMRDDDIDETITMLDRLIDGHLVPNKRIQLLTTGQLTAEMAAPTIYEMVGHDNVSINESELGIIEPNTYLEVYQMLYEVKRVLAGLTAVVCTVLFMVLDHTAVISMMKLRYRQRYGRGDDRIRQSVRRLWQEAYGYGWCVGMVLLTSIFYLAGGGVPYLPFSVIPVIGGMLGLVVARYAERISPVSEDEIMAGESLGMSDGEILTEIVIPSARPGLLQLLNRRTLRFR